MRNATGAIGWGVFVYFGTFAIAVAASLTMGSSIAVARYFYVALPALLLAISIAMAMMLKRRTIALACLAVVLIGACNQALLVGSGYDPFNQLPIDTLNSTWNACQEENVNTGAAASSDQPLVISSNILAAGTLAVTNPDVPQVFITDGSGQAGAYTVFSPTMSFASSVDEVLAGYHGRFIVLDEDNAEENDVYAVVSLAGDLAAHDGIELLTAETFYRPSERNNYTISVLEAR